MDRYALIDNGTVVNLILWDGDTETYTPPYEAVLLADDAATIGSTYADGVFTPPAPRPKPVPNMVTPLQMRKALRHMGLTATVKAFVATQSDEVVEAWEYATEIHRNNALIAAAAAAAGLGMTDSQADDLFRLAATL